MRGPQVAFTRQRPTQALPTTRTGGRARHICSYSLTSPGRPILREVPPSGRGRTNAKVIPPPTPPPPPPPAASSPPPDPFGAPHSPRATPGLTPESSGQSPRTP